MLVIVHVEPDFDFTGDMEYTLVPEIARYANGFDHVINVTSSRVLGLNQRFEALTQFHEEEWLWGFDYAYYTEEEPERWIEGQNWIFTSGHEASEICEWMVRLAKTDRYTLVGGGRNECLQDVYDIFVHLGLDSSIEEKLTY